MNSLVAHLRISLTATVLLAIMLCGVYPLLVWGLAQLAFPHQANGSLLTRADGSVIGSALIAQGFSGPGYFHPRISEAGNGYDPTSSGGSNLGPTSAKLIFGTTKAPVPPAPPSGSDAAATAPSTAAALAPAVSSAPASAAAIAPAAAAAPALVVDNDGIELRVLHYCDDNGIPFDALQDGKPVDLAPYRTSGGWDEVKLITAFNDGDHPLLITAKRAIPVDAVTASASGLDPQISLENARLQAPRVAKARSCSEDQVLSIVNSVATGRQLGMLGEPGVNVLLLNQALDNQLAAGTTPK
jgi:K+-transporting ATPase ATPase C chain